MCEGAKLSYAFYPTRAMLEAEFDLIWATQTAFDPSLTDDKLERLRDTIFFKRPLRPVRPGKCTFFPDRDRLPRWHLIDMQAPGVAATACPSW